MICNKCLSPTVCVCRGMKPTEERTKVRRKEFRQRLRELKWDWERLCSEIGLPPTVRKRVAEQFFDLECAVEHDKP